MAVLNNTGILMGSSAVTAAGSDDYQIEKSLRFNDDDTPYLKRTFLAGNKRKFTWSGWVKRHKLGTRQILMTPYSANGEYTLYFCFDDSDVDHIQIGNYGTSWNFELISAGVFRDLSAWYHILLQVDTTISHSSARLVLWVNGVRQTWKSGDAPAENLETYMNKAGQHDIGQLKVSSIYADYSLADVYFIDGLALTPNSFGKFDSTGVWQPKAFSLATPNNGTTWSDQTWKYVSDNSTVSWSGPLSRAFRTQGPFTNNAYPSSYNDFYWEPSVDVALTQSMSMWASINSSKTLRVEVHTDAGTAYTYVSSGGWTTKWWDFNVPAGSTKLTKLVIPQSSIDFGAFQVDGITLIDGKTDKTWDDWKVSEPMNSGILRSGEVTFESGSHYGSNDATKLFNGITTGGTDDASAGNWVKWTPATPVSFSSKVETWLYGESGPTNTLSLKRVGVGSTDDVDCATADWHTLYTGSGEIEYITNQANGGGNYNNWRAIRVDGVILTDWGLNANSFHLKFNDTSLNRYLGKDTLHGKLEDATGGLPIYNTTDDYGDVKGSGYRSDSDSADLILALPFDSSMTTDVSASVHGSGTNKTFTKGGGYDCNAKQSRFYGTAWDNPNSTSQADKQPGLYMAAHADFDSIGTGDFTIESWLNKPSGQSGNDYWIDNSGLKIHFSNSSGNGISIFDGSATSAWILDASDFIYDQWYHLAIVRTSGSVKTYINGRLKKTVSFTADLGNNATMFIGKYSASDAAHFQGHMQDLRIYTKAKYSSEFTVPYRNDWTVNNLSAAGALLPTDTSVANATGALPIYNTTGTYGGTKGSGNRTDGTSNPYLWVPMDGANNGTTIPDVRSSSRTVTIQGDVKTVTDESKFYGSCGYFDGNGDYLECADSDDWKPNGEFTIEGWFKFAHLNDTQHESLIAQAMSGNDNIAFDLNRRKSNDSSNPGKIQFAMAHSNGGWQYLYSNSALNDLQWHHIAVSIKSDIAKMFIDGTEQTDSFEHGTGTGHNATSAKLTIGAQEYSSGRYPFQGWMQDIRIYGAGKYTQSFTVPNDPTVSIKPEGIDSLTDSPTNYGEDQGAGGEVRSTYCTWNPLDTIDATNVILSQGNSKIQTPGHTTSATAYGTTRGTIGVTSGKWYFEIDGYTQHGSTGHMLIGVIKNDVALPQYCGGTGSISYTAYDGKVRVDDDGGTAYGNTFTTGDVIGVALDMDNGAIYFSKNNTWQNSGSPTSGSSRTNAGATWTPDGRSYTPGISDFQEGSGRYITAHLNTGQRAFKYTAPSGYKCLCTANLPDTFSEDELNNPSKYFDVKTWIGSDNAQTVDGLGFQPDLAWIKIKSGQDAAGIMEDVVRGAGKSLVTNNADGELTNNSSGHIDSFDSDGYSLSGNQQRVNQGGRSYVGWNWDAGTSAATASTDGSITPSAQWVNTTAGFSVSKWTGGGAGNTSTIGHGLGAVPEFFIVKRTNTSSDWIVYHKDVGNAHYLKWNTNDAKVSEATIFNSTSPTNTVITMGTTNMGNNGDFVGYCWTPIKGYSKFGTYTGNSNANGPFIYTGFRPKWVIIKNIVDSGPEAWVVLDSERDKENPIKRELAPSTENVEGATELIDFCSNGFKVRAGDKRVNDNNGSNYLIYCAFAEHPFKTSRAF